VKTSSWRTKPTSSLELRALVKEIREFKMKEREKREVAIRVIGEEEEEDGVVFDALGCAWRGEIRDSHAPIRMKPPPAKV